MRAVDLGVDGIVTDRRPAQRVYWTGDAGSLTGSAGFAAVNPTARRGRPREQVPVPPSTGR